MRRATAVIASLVVVAAIWASVMVGRGEGGNSLAMDPEGPPGHWTLVWQDDFTGNSLDRDRWQSNRYGMDRADAPFNSQREDAWFSSSNVSVHNSNLVLTIREDPRQVDGRTYHYSSGVVQATEPFSILPGSYVEGRIAIPKCDGCWPAFWAVPRDGWPPEIDILEFFDSGTQSRPSFNYHLPSSGDTGPAVYGDPGVDYRDDFHVYGLLWDGSRITPFVDGRAYPEVAATTEVTSLPLMLILNLSVDGGHEPEPGAQMLVDWVRVWTPRADAVRGQDP